MKQYDIKYVPYGEVDKLQTFIEKHWKTSHALVRSTELLDFQHLDKHNNRYNFVVASNKITKDYDALLGFIPSSQYDKNLEENGDYWGAIWKVRTDVSNEEKSFIGIEVFDYLLNKIGLKSIAAIGISSIAKKIYAIKDWQIGFLHHYYIINDRLDKFFIAKNVNKINRSCEVSESVISTSYSVKWLDSDLNGIKIESKYRPYKTVDYFLNRYSKHPFYKYRFLGVYENNKLISIWATRTIFIEVSKVIRVVDVLGELKGNINQQLMQLIYDEEAEYIDFLNYGVDKLVFKQMGFNELSFDEDLIIPNYFEPFEQKNIKIELAYKADFNYVVFKGDSDQDRPNIINSNDD